MKTNADFGKFVYETRPQSNAARMVLYNYMRNYSDLNAPFTPETIHRFYLKALTFEYWQKNSLELGQETRLLVSQFFKNTNLENSWKTIKHADEIQTLKFFHKNDQLEMIHNYFKSKKLNFNFKVYSDKGNLCHAVLAFPNGPIHVYTFDDQACIIQGQLRPLSMDRKLEYNSKLELVKETKHNLQLSPFVGTRFQQQKEIFSGEYIRGYTLQGFKKFEAYSLQEELQIFYTIKKLERFFIDRSTEPLYVDLIQVLEQTLVFLKKNHPSSVELAQKAYLRGQNALDNLFIDDKMIPILLKEVLTELNNKGIQWTPQTLSDSINSSLNPDLPAEEVQTNSF